MPRAVPAICLAALAALASGGRLREQSLSINHMDGLSTPNTVPGLEKFLEDGGIILDFTTATVTDNNLGGYGPGSGPERLTFEGVATFKGRQIDLQIVGDSKYKPNDATNNGMANEWFGQINLKKKRASVMQFTLVDHDSQTPVELPLTAITIWDFDQGNAPGKLTEMATITPFVGYFMRSDSLVNVVEGTESIYFESTVYGNEDDNPDSADNLTETQERKVVAVTFKDISTWNITFGVSATGTGGRNFLFGGHVPNITYTPDPCESYNPLSFNTSTVEYSNLGGVGPDKLGPEGIKYTGVTTKHGNQVDLVVHAEDGVMAYSAYRPRKNGLYGQLGNINLSPGRSVRLNFTFQNVAGKPVELSRFFFTFFDIDMTRKGSAEILKMDSNVADEVSGFTHYYLWPGSTLQVDSTTPQFKFTATGVSTEATNPRSAYTLDDHQADRAVAFFFRDSVSSFAVDFTASPGCYAGRNLLFGGESSVACPEEVIR